MKKIINENTLKTIVRESLKNYLKESMDSELGMGEETEGWTPDMDDMWDEFGNNNVHDTDGAFGVLAQGDDDDHVSRVAKSLRSTKFDTDVNMGEFEDEADEFASDDNAEYLHDKMFSLSFHAFQHIKPTFSDCGIYPLSNMAPANMDCVILNFQ